MQAHSCAFCVRHAMYERRNCDGGAPVDKKPTRTPQATPAPSTPYVPTGWFAWGGMRGTEHIQRAFRPDLLDENERVQPLWHCPALAYQGRWDIAWINRVSLMLDGQCGSAVEWPTFAVDLFARVKAERAADDDARQQYREQQAR